MLKISLTGVWARKRRLVGTFLAVFLGVAFLSGTLVLGDTLRASFDALFVDANAGTDAVVRSTGEVDGETAGPTRGLIEESLLSRVRAVEGVETAEPYVEGYGAIIGADGDAIGGGGPPRMAGSWIADDALNPYEVVEGRAPAGSREVVIDQASADAGDLAVGDATTIETPGPVPVRIVGIVNFQTLESFGGVTFTAFTLADAQRYITKQPGMLSSIRVRAREGVSQEELVSRIASVLPSGVEAITGAELTDENVADIGADFLDFLRTFLVVFAGIALLVGSFSIYNTLSIVVAQRTRESALLRAVGASRAQVLGSVALEALVVGVVASVLGAFAGLGIASLLGAILSAFGPGMPTGSLVFTATTAIVSILVGVVITLAAGLAPALRASRVAPLAALRDVALERTGAGRMRATAGLGAIAVGIALVVVAVVSGGDGVLTVAGIGALVTVVGMVAFGPVIARPASRAIGAPLPRLRGITGRLARQNAMRNPRRTAGTAAALMVGVGVVTLFTVFAASMKASIEDAVAGSFKSDLAISTGFGGAIDPELAGRVARLPEVSRSVGIGGGIARIDGKDENLTIADPRELPGVLDLDVTEGSLEGLGPGELAVSEQAADDNGWTPGSRVPVRFVDGERENLTVGAIYENRDLAGNFFLPRAAWTPHAVQDLDTLVLVQLAPGVTPDEGKAAIDGALGDLGAPEVQTRSEFVDAAAAQIDQFLTIIYVMLVLAIVIALMGIANTLSLAIHERTRELGLLRAVGATRAQLRSMIRWESAIIALFGTVGGVALGTFLGWALVRAAADEGGLGLFSAPVGQLVIVLVIGALAGIVAALRPARRAARLDVLRAVAAE